MKEQRPVTEQDARKATLTVLDYLWQQERSHFLATATTERANHVFAALLILARWLRQDANGEPS